MGASRNRCKEANAPVISEVSHDKKKLSRPPMIGKAPDLTPLVISLVNNSKTGRTRYDTGDAQVRMENALKL